MLSSNDKIKIRMIILIFSTLIPALVYVIIGLYFLQVKNHDTYFEKAKKLYTTTKKSSGKRGEIYTNDGGLLVGNRPCVNIVGDPSLMDKNNRERRIISAILSKFTEDSYQEIYEKLAPMRPKYDKDGKEVLDENGNVVMRVSKYAVLAREVSLDDANKIKEICKQNKIKSLNFEPTYKRTYSKGQLLANILGFTVIDGDSEKALFGIEKAVNEDISSSTSRMVYEIGRDGQKLSYGVFEYEEVKDGKNVYLTINEALQSIVEEELDKAMQEWNPKAVYALMLDPKTGNILAIAQRPTFNPNNRKTINVENTRSRIISDVMEPGSIIKPFTVAFAIDNDYVTPNTIIDCEDGYWIYRGKPLTDSHKIGKVSVTEVMKQSSNVGTAKLGILIGPDNVYNNLYKFGFGQRTGIPLKPESRGTLAPVKKWDGLTISRIPIGYSLNVTPLQMARAYGALANGGTLLPLRLIDRIEDPDTGTIEIMPYAKGVQMFKKPTTAPIMAYMLAQVTGEGGTARRAQVKGFSVAGKTGTSRKYVAGQGYTRKYFASFVGFVPAEKPEFVLLVTIDEPRGRSYYGGTVSGPIFSAISEKALKYLNVSPEDIDKFNISTKE